MARPRSDQKRALLLEAAAAIAAERGDSAPTALIARAAGVAEGTLFTYFRNKEELLTELFAALVAEAYAEIPADLEERTGSREKLLCIWASLLRWGLSNPKRWTAMRVLRLSKLVDERRKRQVRSSGRKFLVERLGIPDEPPVFATRLFSKLIDLTIELTREKPKLAEQYSKAGFEAFMRAVDPR